MATWTWPSKGGGGGGGWQHKSDSSITEIGSERLRKVWENVQRRDMGIIGEKCCEWNGLVAEGEGDQSGDNGFYEGGLWRQRLEQGGASLVGVERYDPLLRPLMGTAEERRRRRSSSSYQYRVLPTREAVLPREPWRADAGTGLLVTDPAIEAEITHTQTRGRAPPSIRTIWLKSIRMFIYYLQHLYPDQGHKMRIFEVYCNYVLMYRYFAFVEWNPSQKDIPVILHLPVIIISRLV